MQSKYESYLKGLMDSNKKLVFASDRRYGKTMAGFGTVVAIPTLIRTIPNEQQERLKKEEELKKSELGKVLYAKEETEKHYDEIW